MTPPVASVYEQKAELSLADLLRELSKEFNDPSIAQDAAELDGLTPREEWQKMTLPPTSRR